MSRREDFINIVCNIADDDSHGYDQSSRWGPDFDCTSLCYYAAHHAGYDVPLGSGYSGTLRKDFVNAGWTAVEYDGNIYDKPVGAIMLREGHHAEVVIGSNQWAGAHINEKGTITGGRSGDQTGKEIGRCAPCHYGSYPNDWDYVIVPPERDGGSGDGGSGGTQPVSNKPSLFVDQYYEHGMLMKLSAEAVGADFTVETEGTPITKVRMYLDSPNGDYSIFYNAVVNGQFLGLMEDHRDLFGSSDDFAGDGVNPIEGLVAYIDKSRY